MRCLLLVTTLAGCSGSFAPLPYQAELEQIVWHEAYGMTRDAPPVEWISVDDFGGGYCDIAWAGWKMQVACGAKCDHPVEDTCLTHSLMHMRTFDRTGDIDAAHTHGDWSLAQRAQDESTSTIRGERGETAY